MIGVHRIFAYELFTVILLNTYRLLSARNRPTLQSMLHHSGALSSNIISHYDPIVTVILGCMCI